MAKKHLNIVLVSAAAIGLAACTAETSHRWNSEAGSFLDEGTFGNPTVNNMIAQKCSGKAKGYSPTDPIVVLDPSSAPSAPKYLRANVTCSGHLNGKYARVIFTEYVRSAQPLPGGGELATGE